MTASRIPIICISEANSLKDSLFTACRERTPEAFWRFGQELNPKVKIESTTLDSSATSQFTISGLIRGSLRSTESRSLEESRGNRKYSIWLPIWISEPLSMGIGR
mmetsp:Transcript_10247/g.15312  ORF Transcript_10247/g.15312 Transcript_10247/m.15312 type:complete len:105 (+) Transcript_10247:434-748(+)